MKINSQTQQKKRKHMWRMTYTHTLFLNENERWYTHILIEKPIKQWNEKEERWKKLYLEKINDDDDPLICA